MKAYTGWIKPGTVIMLLTFKLCALSGCLNFTPENSGNQYKDGWQDDNTYITFAEGIPDKKSNGIEERKKSARKAAVLTAQYQGVEKFRDLIIKPEKYDGWEMTWSEEAVKARQSIFNTIKSGVVLKETYDDNQNCQIIYRVYDKDLKKKILNAWSWPE